MTTLAHALRDGALVAAAASTVVMGSLRANPRLFMRHFPTALRERLAPLSAAEMRAGRVVGALLLLLLVGGPMASTLATAARDATLGFPTLFAHGFVVGMVFNAVDWLILDELWLGVLKPAWALPPGATIDDFQPFDHGRHARGFAAGAILAAGVAAISAAVASVL
ncbi:MAG: hypothetical protein ACOY5Y_04335 [Pseudomonadota bacterium]